jgi:hypothetical protein
MKFKSQMFPADVLHEAYTKARHAIHYTAIAPCGQHLISLRSTHPLGGENIPTPGDNGIMSSSGFPLLNASDAAIQALSCPLDTIGTFGLPLRGEMLASCRQRGSP